jgi:hypothetical protein
VGISKILVCCPVKSWDSKLLALGLVASQSGLEATMLLASRQSWRAIPGLRLTAHRNPSDALSYFDCWDLCSGHRQRAEYLITNNALFLVVLVL